MEANFVHKLKRGKGKYKGKLPFKCFNSGDVGHFAAKCLTRERTLMRKSHTKKEALGRNIFLKGTNQRKGASYQKMQGHQMRVLVASLRKNAMKHYLWYFEINNQKKKKKTKR